MSENKETFEGDINRIKAWIHFKDGSDVDEDTQLLINDVKLLFDTIAERDARIAELESKLSLAVEKLKDIADNCNCVDDISYCVMAENVLKQIGETE